MPSERATPCHQLNVYAVHHWQHGGKMRQQVSIELIHLISNRSLQAQKMTRKVLVFHKLLTPRAHIPTNCRSMLSQSAINTQLRYSFALAYCMCIVSKRLNILSDYFRSSNLGQSHHISWRNLPSSDIQIYRSQFPQILYTAISQATHIVLTIITFQVIEKLMKLL